MRPAFWLLILVAFSGIIGLVVGAYFFSITFGYLGWIGLTIIIFLVDVLIRWSRGEIHL